MIIIYQYIMAKITKNLISVMENVHLNNRIGQVKSKESILPEVSAVNAYPIFDWKPEKERI